MKKNATGALQRFEELERRIAHIVEALQEARRSKAGSDRKLADARKRILELEANLDRLRRERKQVRHRVERLITSVSELNKERKEHVV